MSTSFGALCTDFYVNQKIDVAMDLPTTQETILDLFDRVKKVVPVMDRLRRFDGEIALGPRSGRQLQLAGPAADLDSQWHGSIRTRWKRPTPCTGWCWKRRRGS